MYQPLSEPVILIITISFGLIGIISVICAGILLIKAMDSLEELDND